MHVVKNAQFECVQCESIQLRMGAYSSGMIRLLCAQEKRLFQLEIAAKNADNMAETGRVSQTKRGKTGGPDQIGIPTDAQEEQLTQAARFSQQKRDNKSK